MVCRAKGIDMKIYVASSWRCKYQPEAVANLRKARFDVYDFRHPAPGDNGFHWSEVDGGWQEWTPERYRRALWHPIANQGFKADFDAMNSCDACLLVLPSGRSAHLEAGWFAGKGRPTCVWIPERVEPELMYKCLGSIAIGWHEVVRWAIFHAVERGERTCLYPGCPDPTSMKPPCALCYE